MFSRVSGLLLRVSPSATAIATTTRINTIQNAIVVAVSSVLPIVTGFESSSVCIARRRIFLALSLSLSLLGALWVVSPLTILPVVVVRMFSPNLKNYT